MSYLGYVVVGDKLWTQVCCETIAVAVIHPDSQPVYHLRGSVYIYILEQQHLQHHLSPHYCWAPSHHVLTQHSWSQMMGGMLWHVTCARRHVHSVCWVEDTVDNWLNIIIFSECGRGQWHHYHRQKIPVIIISLNILWQCFGLGVLPTDWWVAPIVPRLQAD